MGTQDSNTVITVREEAGPLSFVFQNFLSSARSATLTLVGFKRKACGLWLPAQLAKCFMGADRGIVYKQNRQPLGEQGHQPLCLFSKRKEGQNDEKSSHGIFSTTDHKTLL